MTFSQFLIKLAVDKYNHEYQKTFNPSDFLIRKIPPNIRTDMGCEIYSIREDDFLRLRIYLVFSDITQLIPYKVEVDKSSSTNDLTDEVHVTTGDINFFYIKENFDLSECGVAEDVVDPEEPVIINRLIREKTGYILTEAGDSILIPDVYPYNEKNMTKLNYCRTSFNGHLNVPVNDHYEFADSIAVSAAFDRIAVSSAFGHNTYTPLNGACTNETTGEVLIYRKRIDNSWVKEASITGLNNGDAFGLSIDMNANGDILTISSCGSVHLYMYIRSGVTWTLYNAIQNTNNDPEVCQAIIPTCNNNVSMSSSGNIILTNGLLKELFAETALDIGTVSIYDRSGSVLTLNSTLDISSETDYGLFGYNLLISKSGNRIIVTNAADFNFVNSSNNIYIYSKIDTTWVLEDTIRGLDSTIFDSSSKHISINEDGTVIAIGASTATISTIDDAGAVYIFNRSGTTWTQTIKISNPDTDHIMQFGNDVKLSGDGNVLYIGTLMKSIHLLADDKYRCYWYAYSYRKINGTWTLESQFHDETKYSLYTSAYYLANIDTLSEEVIIDTNYDGSKVCIASNSFLYIFE